MDDMQNSSAFSNGQNLIGKRVCVKGNKYGIIKFYGNTSFANGLWCGIELDEAVGENDGIFNNICYFACKRDHGIFVLASETIIMNTPVSENYSNGLNSVELMSLVSYGPSNGNLTAQDNFHKFSISNASQPVLFQNSSKKRALNEDYTILKSCRQNKLSVINENSVDLCFANVADLNRCGTMVSTDQALAISTSCKEISDEDFEGNYDSDESLGILPDLLKDISWDSLIFEKDESNRELNSTVNLPYKPVEVFTGCQNLIHKPSSEELLASPICTLPDCIKSIKSPVYFDNSILKYASTPKHEGNYSYIFDKDVVWTQNVSNNLQLDKNVSQSDKEKESHLGLNKTVVIERNFDSTVPLMTNMPTSIHSKTNENLNPQQNILNVTCTKSLDTRQTSLNQMLKSPDVLTYNYILPVVNHTGPNVANKQDHSIEVKEPKYCHFIPHVNPKECGAEVFDSDLYEENILNKMCDLEEASNSYLISHTEHLEATTFPESLKNVAIILNTSLSHAEKLEKTQQTCFLSSNESENLNIEENIVHDKGESILNITYEKSYESSKLDKSLETLKFITNLEKNLKPLQNGAKGKSKKPDVPSFASDVPLKKDKFQNKGSALDKKRNLRSVGGFGKTNINNTELKNTTNLRNLFASNIYTSSEAYETKITNPSHAKDLPPRCSIEGNEKKSFLIDKEKLVDLNSGNLKENFFTGSLLKLASKSGEIKSLSKVKLKSSQESLLNKTLDLPSSISDIGKTVIKANRYSMQFSKPQKKILGLYNVPFYKDNKMIDTLKQKSALSTAEKNEKFQQFNKNGTSLSNKTGLKKPSVKLEEKKRISRFPQKNLSQKNIYTGMQSSAGNCSNIATAVKSQCMIPALKPANKRRISQSSVSKESSNKESKANLNDTILISDHWSNQKETAEAVKPVFISKGLSSCIPPSKIPCISQISRKRDAGEKSSLMILRTGSLLQKPHQYSLK